MCDQAHDGRHVFVLDDITGTGPGGLALVDQCALCGAIAYDASPAADDPRRPPL